MNKIIIAIDGHSSCGKSTIAKALAKALNYTYVDSGAMYRAVTLFALRDKIIGPQGLDEDRLKKHLHLIHIKFRSVDGVQHTFLNKEDVEKEIRSLEVSGYVSQIAKVREVRQHLVREQKKMGKDKGIVMDGRDIGTVVFPSAEIKFFVTASTDVRAARRYEEMHSKGFDNVTIEEIRQNIEERDFLDSHRSVSPLIQANDAILVDTSDMDREEQLSFVLEKVKEVISGS